MTPEFNKWWDTDVDGVDNPYHPDSACYWAWEGWQASAKAEREACAKVCDERERPNLYGVRECATAIRARGEAEYVRGEKPPVKTYAGGKPNYCTPEVPCKTDPDAPHGFDRNASHNADRYVCECEGWEPVDAVNMTQERVDETAKREHEPVAWFIQYEDSHEFVWSKPDGWRVKQALEIQPLYTAPPISDYHEGWEEGFKAANREWVGLTEQDVHDAFQFTELIKQLDWHRETPQWCESFAEYLEAKLKEKNVPQP